MATRKQEISRYHENLQNELNAAFLYDHMAALETNAALAALYRRLAQMERRHGEVWRGKLEELGASHRAFSPDLRTRVLAWLARRFGPGAVIPTIARMEREGMGQHDADPVARAAGIPAEDRSHVRVFETLAGTGMEGGMLARLEGRHRAIGGNALRAGVLGSNDGLVSNLSLVMGVAGANLSPQTILLTGIAGMLAGGLSMALGEWISVQSSRELYQRQIRTEEEELEANPEEEKEELTLIYQAKGMEREEAERTAARIIADRSTALTTLAREELGINPEDLGGSAWEAAGMSFLLFTAGAVVPVIPYLFTEGMAAVAWSVGLSGMGLFLVGGMITLVTGRSLFYSGFRQLLFGLAAAGLTFTIGRILGVAIAG